MSREITVVVRGQTGSVSSLPLKSGGALTAESHNNYRLLVDGKEKLPDGTKIHRSGRDLKIRFADGEEVTIADWAGADGARFETGGAQVYSESLRSFVPAQQVESWQFELLGTGDVAAGQLGVAPDALLASAALAAPPAAASPAISAPASAAATGTAAATAPAAAGAASTGATASAGVASGVAAKTAAAAGGGFSGTGVLLGLGALGGLAAAAGGGGGGSSSGGSTVSSSAAPSTPTGVALAAASDSGTAGDNVTNDTTPTITGRGDAGSTIEVRNASGTVIATATVDAAGNWSATPTTALADGAVTLQVVSNRGTGSTASAAAPISLTIDAAAPAAPVVRLDATSDSGLAGDSRTNDSTPTISGTGNAGDTIRVTLPGGTVLTAVVAANGTWSVTPATALAGGVANLSVTATDVAGNVSTTATAAITIDTAAPAAPALAVPEGPVINAAENADGIQVNVTGAYVAGDTVALVVTRPDASTTTVSRVVTAAEVTAGAVALTVPSQTLQGAYTLRASITDTAGNVGTASAPTTLTLATTGLAAPTLSLTEAADTYINAAEALSGSPAGTPVVVTLPPGTLGGATIALVLSVPGSASVPFSQTVTAGDVAAGFATIVIPTASIAANGAYSVVGTVTDSSGNAGATSAPRAFTVDRTVVAPATPDLATASDTGSSSLDNLTRNTTPTFTGTGAEAGAAVTLYDTNGTTILGTGVADGAGAWSIVAATLSAGVHTVTTKQVDLAGNASVASASLAVTIDATAPTFGKSALTVNEGFGPLTLDAAALSGADNVSTQANLTISAATFKSSGTFLASDLGIAIVNGKATVTPVAGAIDKNGTVVISVSMQDAAGNTATQDVTVTVTPVNDAPIGADRTITTVINGSHTLTTADFAFTDTADGAGDALKSVVISSLPGAGTLRYNGVLVTSGQEIVVADIAAGKLVYAPVPGASGTGYSSFTFQVRDTGGILNGGIDLDATPNKMTVDVSNTGDAGAINLAALSPTAGVRITGGLADGKFGFDVSSAGDANGDGFDDFLVSQRGTVASGGSAYMVYGQAGTYGAIGGDGVRSATIGSLTTSQFSRPGDFMTGVTQLGDVNNDGYADFMIGGVRNNDANTGSAYVVFGAAGTVANIPALGVTTAGGNYFRVDTGGTGTNGIATNAHSLSWVGDVNGDGYDDLIVGARFTPNQGAPGTYTGFGSGAAYVVYGHAGKNFGANNDVDLSAYRGDVTALADDDGRLGELIDAGTGTRGIVYGAGPAGTGLFFGSSVGGLGDRNGDGYTDYGIGADLGGSSALANALLLHGNLATNPVDGGGNIMWLGAPDGFTGPDWIGHGAGPGPNVGVNPYRIRIAGNGETYAASTNYDLDRVGIQTVGDVNGDGYDDFAISYNHVNDPNYAGVNQGKVFIVYGNGTVLDDRTIVQHAAGAAGFLITGAAANDYLGEAVRALGDVNGDGYDDFVVGAPRNEAGSATDQGSAYVIYGRADAGADDLNLATGVGARGIAIRGAVAGDQAGFGANSAGDVNGDGLDDLIVSAPQNDIGGTDAGAAYLLYGSTAYGNSGAKSGTNLTGTAGADSLIGTAAADTLSGGAGGADAISGGAGNDVITVGSNGWLRVDGGAGFDTLKVGAALALDFTAIGTAAGQNLSGHTRSIERIDLGVAANASTLKLSEQDVYQLAGDFATPAGGSLTGRQSNSLFILGDAADTFTFAEGVAGATGWAAGATLANPVGDGNAYTLFTRGSAEVYVASAVAITGVTVGTAAANTLTGTGAAEVIAGAGGADFIFGGGGNDTLYGGAVGATAATSDAGVKDIFAYTMTANTANGDDVIKDFQVSTDRLYLTNVADSYNATTGPSSSVAVTASAPNGSTAAFAANGTTYQGFNAAAAVTATTNNDIDNNLSIRDLTQADSANQYISFGTDGNGNVKLTMVAGTATSTLVLEGVQYEASATAANGKYGSLAELMGGGSETRVLYLTNDPFSGALT